ncbi:hypothetical protein LIER_01933 [Lithospermum erythrorhizon]|uniref:Uncharacterized protein n=1 Tax=Lithospermum erythrorhizon TaxID=34254 RepID=A0AAV3NMM8_LITER
MSGVHADLAIHRLYSDPSFRHVTQKKRNFSYEKNLSIPEEVEELVHANAIRELQFPEWIVNIVMSNRQRSSGKFEGDPGSVVVIPSAHKSREMLFEGYIGKVSRLHDK